MLLLLTRHYYIVLGVKQNEIKTDPTKIESEGGTTRSLLGLYIGL